MSDWIQNITQTEDGKKLLQREELLLAVSCLIHDKLTAEKLSQEELAARLGVTPGRVSQLLSGQQNLTLRTLSDMAFALGYGVQIVLVKNNEIVRDSRPKLEWNETTGIGSINGVALYRAGTCGNEIEIMMADHLHSEWDMEIESGSRDEAKAACERHYAEEQ